MASSSIQIETDVKDDAQIKSIHHNKDKRILWIINHTTLRDFEVPFLISLGYEVYTPKRIPPVIKEWSGSVDYAYDKELTIPAKALEVLNNHNFYSDPISTQVANIINRYFGTAFLVFYPNVIDQMSLHFEGRILLRAFGLDKNHSYSSVIKDIYGNEFFKRIRKIQDRFWFSEAYENLHEVENDLLTSRSIFHPLGLPESFYKNADTWNCKVDKILFFCSRITSSPTYYGEIYKQFKQYFADIPHLIAGNQPTSVDDANVAGFQPRETIDEWLRTYAVMFYHSQEARHLHYHPLEAIIVGMPLVYMRGGILEQFGGEVQPGACATFEEAREKVQRILNGDQALIADILKHQKKLIAPFTLEYNHKIWEQNFISKVMTTKLTMKKNKLTIGVFLPVGYQGGTLNGAKNIAKMLQIGSKHYQDDVTIVFSCVANTYNIESEFADLKELGIKIRETTWKEISRDQLHTVLKLAGKSKNLKHASYLLPTDGCNNFNDCDFWLLISDRLMRPLAPLKNYGVVIYDYIQRYVPEIVPKEFDIDNVFATSNDADIVFTTTPTTREDAIQYGGLKAAKIHLLPMEFKTPVAEVRPCEQEDYFIWTSNSTPHKNHARAIEALNIYYTELNGTLDVVMTGVNTDFFDLDKSDQDFSDYVKQIRALIASYPAVQKHLKIRGNMSSQDYATTLMAAKFLWHPAIIDNGTYSVIEAAYYNRPSVCSYYPQMEYINQRFNLNLEYFDSRNAKSIAEKLKKLELEHVEKAAQLPSQEFLTQFNYNNLATEYWDIFRSLV